MRFRFSLVFSCFSHCFDVMCGYSYFGATYDYYCHGAGFVCCHCGAVFIYVRVIQKSKIYLIREKK